VGIAQPHAAVQRPLAVIDEDLARKLPARILVVEDNPVNSKVALRFLQIMGYKPGMHVALNVILSFCSRNSCLRLLSL